MIYKTLHRKLNIEQHEPHYKTDFKIKTTLTTGIKDKYKGCEGILIRRTGILFNWQYQ
jgi:hypothetical protein